MGRPPIGKTAMTDAERMRRYRLKHGTAKPVTKPVTKPAGTDAALAQELAAAKARIAALELEREQRANAAKAAPRDKDDRIAELEEEIRALQLHIRFGPKRRPAEPKAEKPPLPPDEERDRIIKGLKTRVRNFTFELHAVREHAKEVQGKTGGMDFQTMSAIAKCLFPDQRDNATECGQGQGVQAVHGMESRQRQGTTPIPLARMPRQGRWRGRWCVFPAGGPKLPDAQRFPAASLTPRWGSGR